MLISFRLENFKSFRDSAVLDLSATRLREHPQQPVQIGSERILPVAGILGPNGSGKSNLLQAFDFMSLYVQNSLSFGEEARAMDHASLSPRVGAPFLLDPNKKNAPSEFEVWWIDPADPRHRTWNYGFAVSHRGVHEEWLNIKAKTSREYREIFYRDEDILELPGIPKKNHQSLRTALRPVTLLSSLGRALNVEILEVVTKWFSNTILADFGDPVDNVFWSRHLPAGFEDDQEVQEDVCRYLKTFDSSITGFNVEVLNTQGDEKLYQVYTKHVANNGETVLFRLKDEAAGTLKMLALYGVLRPVLENGGVLVIDELNSRLHPLLARNFLTLFLNPKHNPHHAQLVFSTHDAWILDADLLRRDEVWFTSKSKDGSSQLFSLAEFKTPEGKKIRNDADYMKNYLLGRYGAIPELNEIIFSEDKSGVD